MEFEISPNLASGIVEKERKDFLIYSQIRSFGTLSGFEKSHVEVAPSVRA